jgi:hypothetical protein
MTYNLWCSCGKIRNGASKWCEECQYKRYRAKIKEYQLRRKDLKTSNQKDDSRKKTI